MYINHHKVIFFRNGMSLLANVSGSAQSIPLGDPDFVLLDLVNRITQMSESSMTVDALAERIHASESMKPFRNLSISQISQRLSQYQSVSALLNSPMDNPPNINAIQVTELSVDVLKADTQTLPEPMARLRLGTHFAISLCEKGDAYMGTSTMTMEEKAASNVELHEYYTAQVAERYDMIKRGLADDDLLTGFITAEGDNGRKLTPEEVVRFCITMVAGGAESSVFLIGNQVAAMLEMPELYQQMREDRSLVRPFLEESIRRDGPIQRLFRETLEDTEIAGTPIKKGEWVCVFFGAGNHDPEMFENPHEFILHRPNVGKNLTFSHGIHHCIASLVARNEAAGMINGILDRYKAVEPGDGPVTYQDRNFINFGPSSCPVNFVPA